MSKSVSQLVTTLDCGSVRTVVLLANYAIDRGSNLTVDDTVVKKIEWPLEKLVHKGAICFGFLG